MPSHRDRSASPRIDKDREREHRRRHDDRDKRRSRDDERDRSERKHKKSKRERTPTPSDDDDLLDLRALGVKEISEDDYFLKSAEYKYWLKEEKGKYLDELSSESAHKYFRRFVRRWNDGALKERYYATPPSTAGPSSSNTAYKWSFASNRSRIDADALAAARADVNRLTHPSDISSSKPANPPGPSLSTSISSKALGPSLPTAQDRQFYTEQTHSHAQSQRKSERKNAYERANDLVPRSGGKEGKMDEKRANNAVNREFREKEVGGLEVDEEVLLGGGGGFAAALKARDAANSKRGDKRAAMMADRRAADEERLQERKVKESATMDMFKAMAKERFG